MDRKPAKVWEATDGVIRPAMVAVDLGNGDWLISVRYARVLARALLDAADEAEHINHERRVR